jgi:hypothetical protein
MSTVFGDDRVRDLKTKTDALDEIYGLLGANLSQGLASIHLVNLSTAMSRWVSPPIAFLKEPRRSKPFQPCSLTKHDGHRPPREH